MVRRTAGLLLLTAGAPVLSGGCSSTSSPVLARQPSDQSEAVTAALDAAVAAVDTSRTQLLNRIGPVVDAVTALDAADEACATGQVGSADRARAHVHPTLSAAAAAQARMPGLLAAYRSALRALQATAVPLPAAQEQPLDAVAATGQAEATSAEQLAARTGLPVFDELDRVQATWVRGPPTAGTAPAAGRRGVRRARASAARIPAAGALRQRGPARDE